MKNTLTGLLSGILLICVLVGNTLFTAYDSGLHAAPAMTEVEDTVRLPVLMYHHMLKDSSRSGDYVITPDQFERDLIEIKNEGYTTVSIQQIVDYFEADQPLPEQPILLTFDDGYESFHEYAFPLLQKHQMKASVMIIGKYTDLYSADVVKDVSYSHANWDQLREMLDSGLVEVGNHTYGLHGNERGGRKGASKLSGESFEQYEKLLSEDVSALNREISSELSVLPLAFAYPFGAFSEETDRVLDELGFKVRLTCREKVNLLSRADYASNGYVHLMRFNRASRYSTQEIFQKLAG